MNKNVWKLKGYIRWKNSTRVNCSLPWQYCVNGLSLNHLYCYLQESSGPLKWMGTEAFDFIFRIPSSRWVMFLGWKETLSYDLLTLISNGQQPLAIWYPQKLKGKKNLKKEVSTAVRERNLYVADDVCTSSSQMWSGCEWGKSRKLWSVIPWPSESLPHFHQLFP